MGIKLQMCLLAAGAALWCQPAPQSSGVVPRSIQAIGYTVGGGATNIDLKNTGLVPQVSGRARVESKPGITTVEVKIRNLRWPSALGAEFLTYVAWAVSTEGRAMNLGPVLFSDSGEGKLKATTPLQSFSLFVTAEPYSTVRQPSEMLILENAVRDDTKGTIFMVDGYRLMRRTEYQKLGNPLSLSPDLKNTPLEMYEARNAVDIATSRAADKYAPEVFTKAEASLRIAENALAGKANRKEVASKARQAAQFAEDARALSMERQEQERIDAERAAAAARATAEERRRQAELAAEREGRLKAEAAARQAQIKAEAVAREARLQREADMAAASAKAEADALRAREEAARSEADRTRQDAEALRARLLDQFNRILETRDTARGLVITMADVLFDTGKHDLGSDAREKLARLSGIVLAHPELHLDVEGHTDGTGSDDFNQRLSEQRASRVREFLIRQGLSGDDIASRGFGKDIPVASNDTAAGRQKNRRVELIVSGEVIGVRIGKGQ